MKKIILKAVVFITIALLLLMPTNSMAVTVEEVSLSQNSTAEMENLSPSTQKYMNQVNSFQVAEELSYAEGTAPSHQALIGAILTIFQLLGMLIVFLIIMYEIISRIRLSIIIKRLEKDDTVGENKAETLEKYKKALAIHKKRTIIVVVIILILLFAVFVIQTTKEFAKPIIYIYPEEDGTEVTISLENPDILTCTYPKYNDGWKVTADKDGTLTDETGRKYYALYWEGDNKTKESFEDGFVVKGEDVASFLEEKLEILGLNEKEAEEFIVYWLPKLEKNRYNLIRFKTTEEMNEAAKLNISPEPDTLIRVMMEFKPLLIKKDVKEQLLTKVERKGYTIVEWGATEY